MMNKNRYKEAFNAIFPSEEAVERIYEITTDKKKFSYKKAVRRVAALAMAFVLVIGGGFGIDLIAKTNHTDNTLGIYIAYGSENELVQVNNNNAPPMFYRYYIIKDSYSKEKKKQIEAEYEKDRDNQRFYARQFSQASSGSYGPKFDENGKFIGEVFTVENGVFFLDIKDYSKVDKITVEETSKNGKIDAYLITKKPKDFNEDDDNFYAEEDKDGMINFISQSENMDQPDCLEEIRFNSKVVITGEELKFSRDSGICTLGVGENEINTGYTIAWNSAFDWQFDLDINFNLQKVKGSIVFTVDYTDGTSEQSTVNYHFDKDGYMNLSMK